MKNAHILLLCILGAALVSSVVCQSGIAPKSCCFKFYETEMKKERVKSYKITDTLCKDAGVIFETTRNHHICVDPSVSWVQDIMKHVDENL